MNFVCTCCLLWSLVAVGVADRGNVVGNSDGGNGVLGGGGDNGLTGGLGELVLDILAGDLAASVGHGLGDRVSNSVGHGQRGGHSDGGSVGNSDGGNSVVGNSDRSHGVGKTGVGKTGVGEVLGISLGVGLSISGPLAVVAGVDNWGNGGVTEDIGDLSALLGVLDLLGGDGLGGADLLSCGGAHLGDQDDILGHAGGGGGGDSHGSGGVGGVSQDTGVSEELRVGISLSSRGSASKGGQAGQGDNLSVHDDWMTSHEGS